METIENKAPGMDVFKTEGLDIRYKLDEAKQVIKEGLDKKYIWDHPAKKDKNGKPLKYAPQHAIVQMLNEAFNYQWNFEIVKEEVVQAVPKWDKKTKQYVQDTNSFYIKVLGRLTVPGLGYREQYGSKILVGGVNEQESAAKAAASDALKKCATLFGIGLELYDKEEELLMQEEDQGYYHQQSNYQKRQYSNNYQNNYQSNYQKPQTQQSATAQNGQSSQAAAPDQWPADKVNEMKQLMKQLQVDSNSISIYLVEYFNDMEANINYVTPQNIGDVVNFLKTKVEATNASQNHEYAEWGV